MPKTRLSSGSICLALFVLSCLLSSLIGCSGEQSRPGEDVGSSIDANEAMQGADESAFSAPFASKGEEASFADMPDHITGDLQDSGQPEEAPYSSSDTAGGMYRPERSTMTAPTMTDPTLARSSQRAAALQPAARMPEPFDDLPAGASYDAAKGFATIEVFYATDRAPNPVPLSAYQLRGAKTPVIVLIVVACGFAVMAMFSILRKERGRRSHFGALSAMGAAVAGVFALMILKMGVATIEKHGVTYTAERGALQRGVATVTVPDTHKRGEVERPSLLRFEFREDQTKHIVMTSAIELDADEFHRRLTATVEESPQGELLVFIHGYNVDFDSAVLRTAQLAVDLPFRGVPVCYSWPSQAQLAGYTIDENNVAWTVHHLKTFLYELAERSGAESINVIAHSMGNRALTSALSEISYELAIDRADTGDETPFLDRVVLAAPDVDADHFRRDLAPKLLETAASVTLYASSDDNALIASKTVHGYPRAGESGQQLVIVPGIETVDVTGVDLSLLGHSYYGDNEEMLHDLFELVHDGLPAAQRAMLRMRELGGQIYWQLAQEAVVGRVAPSVR